jgi:hypothetical protein
MEQFWENVGGMLAIGGALLAGAHFYVSKIADDKAEEKVKEHINSCPVPAIIGELHKDVREIRNYLLSGEIKK